MRLVLCVWNGAKGCLSCLTWREMRSIQSKGLRVFQRLEQPSDTSRRSAQNSMYCQRQEEGEKVGEAEEEERGVEAMSWRGEEGKVWWMGG